MTRTSPNKRKSLAAATPGQNTPKKTKLEPQSPKSPKNTPKSVKKGIKLENGVTTPAMGKTPKSLKKGKMANGVKTPKPEPQSPNSETAVTAKTPKSAKKGKKQANTPKPPLPDSPEVSSEEKMEVADEQVVPKTTDNATKIPKSKKKGKKPNLNTSESSEKTEDSPKTEKLQKFQGTRSSLVTPELAKNLTKNQMRRLIKKLKKQANIVNKKEGQEDNVAQKSIAEITQSQSPSDKKNKKKNKKNKSILNKSIEVTETKTEAKMIGGTKKGKKGANTIKSLNVPDTYTTFQNTKNDSTDESDYEVETQIKPEKITKPLNNPGSDDELIISAVADDDLEDDASSYEEDDDNEQVEEKKVKEEKPQKTKSNKIGDKKGEKPQKPIKLTQTLDIKDLSKSGIVNKGQTRYVLYVNNIPYDTTKDQIKEHFAKVCTLKDVRIPTDKKTNRPKGFCYVELSTEEEYQKALSIHHSFMNHRRINVLYTSPGEKNSVNKKKEIKKKNLKLQGMRNKGMFQGVPKDSQKRSVRRAKKRIFDKKQADAEQNN